MISHRRGRRFLLPDFASAAGSNPHGSNARRCYPTPEVHTIPPASSVTPTQKSVVSSGVSIQFLRILRLDRCTCLGAGSLQTINEWLKTPSDLLKAMFGRQMGSRCASSLG